MQLQFFKDEDVTLYKANYENGRLAVVMKDEDDYPFGNLTVNLPDHQFFSEVFDDEPNAAFIEHFDAFATYNQLIDWLEDNELVETRTDGSIVRNVVGSGFNQYAEVIFKTEVIEQLPELN